MEIKTTMVMREVPVSQFIACDGKVFGDYNACTEYEKKLEEKKLEEKIGRIPRFFCTPPVYDVDSEFRWYLVKSPEELDAIKKFHFVPDSSGCDFDPKKYPALIRVEVYADTCCGYIEDYESVLESAESYLEELRELGEVLDDSDDSELQEEEI